MCPVKGGVEGRVEGGVGVCREGRSRCVQGGEE